MTVVSTKNLIQPDPKALTVRVPVTPSERTDDGGCRAKRLTRYDRLSAQDGADTPS
jgi:hypothetical protein